MSRFAQRRAGHRIRTSSPHSPTLQLGAKSLITTASEFDSNSDEEGAGRSGQEEARVWQETYKEYSVAVADHTPPRLARADGTPGPSTSRGRGRPRGTSAGPARWTRSASCGRMNRTPAKPVTASQVSRISADLPEGTRGHKNSQLMPSVKTQTTFRPANLDNNSSSRSRVGDASLPVLPTVPAKRPRGRPRKNPIPDIAHTPSTSTGAGASMTTTFQPNSGSRGRPPGVPDHVVRSAAASVLMALPGGSMGTADLHGGAQRRKSNSMLPTGMRSSGRAKGSTASMEAARQRARMYVEVPQAPYNLHPGGRGGTETSNSLMVERYGWTAIRDDAHITQSHLPADWPASYMSVPYLPTVYEPAPVAIPYAPGVVQDYQTEDALHASLLEHMRAWKERKEPFRFHGSWAVVTHPNTLLDEVFIRRVADRIVRRSEMEFSTERKHTTVVLRGENAAMHFPCQCMQKGSNAQPCGGRMSISLMETEVYGIPLNGVRTMVEVIH